MLGHKGSDYSVAFSVEVSIAVHRIQIQLTPASMIQRAEHSHICSLNQRDAKRGLLFSSVNSRRAYIPTRIQTEIRLAYAYEPGHRRFEKACHFVFRWNGEKAKRKKTYYNFDIINIEGNNRKKESNILYDTFA